MFADIAVAVAVIFAVVVSTWAIIRSQIPPQTREVRALRAEVEELGDDLGAVHERLNERAARSNLQAARQAREAKRERHAGTISEAEQIIAAQGSAGVPATSPGATADPEVLRTALRRKHLQ